MARKKQAPKEEKASGFENAVLQVRFVDEPISEEAPVEVKEVKAEAVEIVTELPVEELPKEEVVEEPKKEKEVEVEETPPTPIKPPKFYHVDQFLQTAIPMFGLNNMQARGFKARMQGRQYQEDMQVFVDELKKYLNIQ